MNKKQKDVVLDNLNETISQSGNVETISWPAGSVSYNLGMRSTWTKAQQEYLDDKFDKLNNTAPIWFVEFATNLNQRLDNIEKDVNEMKQDIKDMKNTPTMKRELESIK